MSELDYTCQIELFGVTIGDCVISVSYDDDAARHAKLADRPISWKIETATVCGEEVLNVRFGYNRFDEFLASIGDSSNPNGLESVSEKISEMVESHYDANV